MRRARWGLTSGHRRFIASTASGTCTSPTDAHYCMCMLVAADTSDLLDARSWTKSPVPVFQSSDVTHEYGPGHNSFTVDRSGADVLVYHARAYREIVGDPLHDPNRDTRAQ